MSPVPTGPPTAWSTCSTSWALRPSAANLTFLEIAESHGKVVCSVHLGLIQGVLEAWEAPVGADRLDEFVAPDLCLLHLKPTATKK